MEAESENRTRTWAPAFTFHRRCRSFPGPPEFSDTAWSRRGWLARAAENTWSRVGFAPYQPVGAVAVGLVADATRGEAKSEFSTATGVQRSSAVAGVAENTRETATAPPSTYEAGVLIGPVGTGSSWWGLCTSTLRAPVGRGARARRAGWGRRVTGWGAG